MKQIYTLTIVSIFFPVFCFAQNYHAPDYSKLENWAASPYKMDPSDNVPKYLNDSSAEKRADVFFIHPTSYFAEEDTASWNAWLTDTVVNNETDSKSIHFQATVFNGSCRIFAPRYRQGNMEAFYAFTSQRAIDAFELAYQDVKAAFQYYLQHENKNRPIIIASHSQGTLHAIRLLQEFFDGKPLQKRLVCAYIPGYQIKKDAFKKLPVGETPEQIGCFVGWRSFEKGEISKRILSENGNSVCVNPLNWSTNSEWVSKELHLGIMNGKDTIVPHTVAAGIEPKTKILWVKTPEVIIEHMDKGTNLHIYDFNLFWMNIRENVKQRIDAYLKAYHSDNSENQK